MSGALVGGGGVFGTRSIGDSAVVARCRLGRWQLGLVGFFGYIVPGLLVAIAVDHLVDAVGSETTLGIRLAIAAAVPVIAAWRGATVSAAVQRDAVRVRNRWRTVVVPFGEIEAVEVRSSALYGVLGFALSIYELFSTDYAAVRASELTRSDLLAITRRGHRRRLPLYGTLGMARDLDAMQPFLAALAAAGHPVDLDPSSIA